MGTDGEETEHGGSSKVVLLRDYVRTMGDRLASLRGRASGDGTSEVLAEAFHELEVTREELTVADEEIASVEARFEEALRAAEAKVRHYAELFHGSPDGYVLTDTRGVMREGNRTFSAMVGVPQHFLEGKPFVNFVARADVRSHWDSLAALLRGGAGDAISLRLRPRDGKPVFVAEVVRRVVRGVGDHVTSIRWSVRPGAARAPDEPSSGEPVDDQEDGALPSGED
jgi:PAS domain S-box-containing protein